MSLRDIVAPLLRGTPGAWHGLPPTPASDFDAAFGPPLRSTKTNLGFLPADRLVHDTSEGELIAWIRRGQAVMIEVAAEHPVSVLGGLEQPCVVLPQEILVPEAYARERLYCERGLVVTVAHPFDGTEDRIVRFRGISPIATPAEFGTDLYKPFEDRASWR